MGVQDVAVEQKFHLRSHGSNEGDEGHEGYESHEGHEEEGCCCRGGCSRHEGYEAGHEGYEGHEVSGSEGRVFLYSLLLSSWSDFKACRSLGPGQDFVSKRDR